MSNLKVNISDNVLNFLLGKEELIKSLPNDDMTPEFEIVKSMHGASKNEDHEEAGKTEKISSFSSYSSDIGCQINSPELKLENMPTMTSSVDLSDLPALEVLSDEQIYLINQNSLDGDIIENQSASEKPIVSSCLHDGINTGEVHESRESAGVFSSNKKLIHSDPSKKQKKCRAMTKNVHDSQLYSYLPPADSSQSHLLPLLAILIAIFAYSFSHENSSSKDQGFTEEIANDLINVTVLHPRNDSFIYEPIIKLRVEGFSSIYSSQNMDMITNVQLWIDGRSIYIGISSLSSDEDPSILSINLQNLSPGAHRLGVKLTFPLPRGREQIVNMESSFAYAIKGPFVRLNLEAGHGQLTLDKKRLACTEGESVKVNFEWFSGSSKVTATYFVFGKQQFHLESQSGHFSFSGALPGEHIAYVKMFDEFRNLLTEDKFYLSIYSQGSKEFSMLQKKYFG